MPIKSKGVVKGAEKGAVFELLPHLRMGLPRRGGGGGVRKEEGY